MSNKVTKKVIALGQNKYIATAAVASVNVQLSAKFRATETGFLDGKPIDEVSNEEMTLDAFVLVWPTIGSVIGLKTSDDLAVAYAEEIVDAINFGHDVVGSEKFAYVEPEKEENPIIKLHEQAEAESRAADEAVGEGCGTAE
tara:strand:+ start:767 stop:1192 length:426 start_codon:yes stop_codon:yes gene_type:complete